MPKHDTCMNCGAWVEDSYIAKDLHTKFHEDIDELIDWAQHVSKLFGPNSSTSEGGLRGLLRHINDGVVTPGEAMASAGIELQEGPDNPD